MNKNNNSLNFVINMALFTVFAMFLTLILLMGASSFRNISENAEERFNERTPLLYMTQRIRSFDSIEAVRIGEVDGIPALILTETFVGGKAVTYIYYYNGSLNENLVFGDDLPVLRLGTTLFPIDSINFNLHTSSLIEITINEKSIFVNLSSEVDL
jgi:hypothetical protein